MTNDETPRQPGAAPEHPPFSLDLALLAEYVSVGPGGTATIVNMIERATPEGLPSALPQTVLFLRLRSTEKPGVSHDVRLLIFGPDDGLIFRLPTAIRCLFGDGSEPNQSAAQGVIDVSGAPIRKIGVHRFVILVDDIEVGEARLRVYSPPGQQSLATPPSASSK